MRHSRRDFLARSTAAVAGVSLAYGKGVYASTDTHASMDREGLFEVFKDPPHEFSVVPFWFLNDDLEDGELRHKEVPPRRPRSIVESQGVESQGAEPQEVVAPTRSGRQMVEGSSAVTEIVVRASAGTGSFHEGMEEA